MTFSENLVKLRNDRGLSQKELSEKTGVTMRAYQRYEYGEREPRLSVLIALADFYGISLDELACRRR